MAAEQYEPNVVLSNTTYDVIGTRPIRHDGADKVTGRANGRTYSVRSAETLSPA